jgi:hypothetical protein
MGEVISVDFKRGYKINPNSMHSKFLDMLRRRGVEEDDVQDVIDAIADHEFYLKCDPDIKRIVEVFFEHMVDL